jgi:hypothetical protein
MTPRYPWIARDYLEMKRTALTLDLRWFLRLRLWASQDQRFLEHQRLLGRSFEQDVEELTALHGHLYRQPENQKWTVALRQNNGAEMLELRSGCGVLRFPWGEWPDGWAEMDDPPGTIICQVEV